MSDTTRSSVDFGEASLPEKRRSQRRKNRGRVPLKLPPLPAVHPTKRLSADRPAQSVSLDLGD